MRLMDTSESEASESIKNGLLLARNVRLLNKEGSFIVVPHYPPGKANLTVNHCGKEVFWSEQAKIYVMQLIRTSADQVFEFSLRTHVSDVVFNSRFQQTPKVRSNYLKKVISKMLPNYNVVVFVWDENSNNRPQVVGKHKGDAIFMEPEFGSHVYILLV